MQTPQRATNPQTDPQRPRYHFLPPSGWLNDPNGLIEVGGLTHLFYQHNPHGAFHDAIHWGHAVSRDLVHWEHLPIALYPTPDGPDAKGCWSGCAVLDGGVPTLLYTGVHPQVQCLATSDNGLLTWHKQPRPILAEPPPDIDVFIHDGSPAFRDPFVWREGETWRMVVGVGFELGGGGALLYSSPDLRAWTYDGVAHRGRFEEGGYTWECPNLFALDGRHVLLVSEWGSGGTHAQVGSFDGLRFSPSWTGRPDHGHSFFAPLTFADSRGRRLMFAWLREERSDAAQLRAGWSGVISLPRELRVEDDLLLQRPVPELESLRREGFSLQALTLTDGESRRLEVEGDDLEVELSLEELGAACFELTLRASPDGEERTLLELDGGAGLLTVDTRHASLDPEANGRLVCAPHVFGKDPRLRVFVDASVVEVFLDERICLSARVYPTRPDSLGVEVASRDGAVTIRELRAWQTALLHSPA